jgi:hypothetical protein
MKDEPTVSLAPDFYTLRIEVEEFFGGRLWLSFRQWRSRDLPDFILYEETEPSAVHFDSDSAFTS